MISPIFYLFAALMVAGGLMVVFMRNPVASALSMVLCFIGLAGLFVGLNAYFVGILQVLVYAGAIMVLFIFIIMLIDLKKSDKDHWKGTTLAVGIAIPAILLVQLAGVLSTVENSPQAPKINFEQALKATDKNGELVYKEDTMIRKRLEAGRLPDTHLIGNKLFTDYNFPLQVIAVLLLVATVGCVTLSKKSAVAPVPVTANVRSINVDDQPEAVVPADVTAPVAVKAVRDDNEPVESTPENTQADEEKNA